MLLARVGHAPFSSRLDGAFREYLFSGCNRGGLDAVRFGFHLVVREDPPFAGLRFVTVFCTFLLPFTADLCNGLNLYGHFGGFVS